MKNAARLVAKLDGPRMSWLTDALVEPYRLHLAPVVSGADTIDSIWVAHRIKPVLLLAIHGPRISWPQLARQMGIRGVTSQTVYLRTKELEAVLGQAPEGIYPRYAREPVRDITGCLAYIDGHDARRETARLRRHEDLAKTLAARRPTGKATSDALTIALRALSRFAETSSDRLARNEMMLITNALNRGENLSTIARRIGRSYDYVARHCAPGSPLPKPSLRRLALEPITRKERVALPDDHLAKDAILWDFLSALLARFFVSYESLATALGVSERTFRRTFVEDKDFRLPLTESTAPPASSPRTSPRHPPPLTKRTARPASSPRTSPQHPPPLARRTMHVDNAARIRKQWKHPYGVSSDLAQIWEDAGISATEGGVWAQEGFLPEHYRWISEHFPLIGPEAARQSIRRGLKVVAGKESNGSTVQKRSVVELPSHLPPLWS